MMRSLFSGVSGLKSHQTRMDVIGNNISNINTVGFKSSRTTFSDMLSQTQTGSSSPTARLGGTNPKQIGLGAAVASVDLVFSDGSPQATGKNTDVALSGNGLFVLKNGDNYFYSRDGAFEFDAAGNYVLPGSGLYVQGWNAVNGALNTNATPTNIIVPAGKTMEASATTTVDYSGNLNSNSPIITSIQYTKGTGSETVAQGGIIDTVEFLDSTGGTVTGATSLSSPGVASAKITTEDGDEFTVYSGKYEGSLKAGELFTKSVNVDGVNAIAAILTLSDGTTQKVTNGYYEIGHSIPVTTVLTAYDSEGNKHAVTVLIDKASAYSEDDDADDISSSPNPDDEIQDMDNRWRVYIAPGIGNSEPATSYTITESDGSITTGYLNATLDEDGNPYLPDINPSSDPDRDHPQVSYVWFNNDGSYDSIRTDGGSIYLSYSNGNGAAPTNASITFTGLTQYAGSTTAFPTADGNAFGVLQSVAIDTAGIITGTYTNGVRQFEAQIAVAQFINSAGLTKTGTSMYQESNNSGAANIKTVTDLGLTITPSALEMSNVELASELADMIVTQRGFQSNSKTITVSDEMLETLINMKR